MALFGKKKGELLTELPEVLPQHVGIIMDGNGRWAKKRGLPRPMGHIEGARTFKKIIRHCKDIGLKHLSFYAFSTENWNRPEDEVAGLMKIFSDYLDDISWLHKEKTRLIFLGDKARFSEKLRNKMIAAKIIDEEDTF